MKSIQIRSFSGPYFPVVGLNKDIYFVFSLTTGKYVPEKTPYLDTFHAVNTDVKWVNLWQPSGNIISFKVKKILVLKNA